MCSEICVCYAPAPSTCTLAVTVTVTCASMVPTGPRPLSILGLGLGEERLHVGMIRDCFVKHVSRVPHVFVVLTPYLYVKNVV
jgi:hypothetical protein